MVRPLAKIAIQKASSLKFTLLKKVKPPDFEVIICFIYRKAQDLNSLLAGNEPYVFLQIFT